MFMGLAGMEDAQVKAGNGLVKRQEATEMQQESMSTADYFAAKKASMAGTVEFEALQERKKRQAGFRRLLDGKVRKLVAEDMRYR
jgi:hypothetical protein